MGVVPFYTATRNVRECLFSHNLSNKIHQTFGYHPVKWHLTKSRFYVHFFYEVENLFTKFKGCLVFESHAHTHTRVCIYIHITYREMYTYLYLHNVYREEYTSIYVEYVYICV